MAVRFLLDENLEHEVCHRLEGHGYDATHVENESNLGKGARDSSIAAFSRREQRVVVTYDPDFVREYDESDYFGAVYFDDDDLSAGQIVDVLRSMASRYPDAEFQQLQFGGREWL